MDPPSFTVNMTLGDCEVSMAITIKPRASINPASPLSVSFKPSTPELTDAEARECVLKQQLLERKSIAPSPQIDQATIATLPLSSVHSDNNTADATGYSTDIPSDTTVVNHRDDSPASGTIAPQPTRVTLPLRVDSYNVERRVQTPPGTPPHRPPSPSVIGDEGRDDDRGRRAYRSPSNSRDSRSTSRSTSHSRSRDSRASSRDGRRVTPGDDLLVEREDASPRILTSLSLRPPPYTPMTVNTSPRQYQRSSVGHNTIPPPLRSRISDHRPSELNKPKRHLYPTCPFYHPSPNDKHELGTPHPGYTQSEFDEAVMRYGRGEELPPYLIKHGAEVNHANRNQVRSPTSSRNTANAPTPDRYAPQGRPAHQTSTSMDGYSFEPPAKRRRIISDTQSDSYRPSTHHPSPRERYGRSRAISSAEDYTLRQQYSRQTTSHFLSIPSHSGDRYSPQVNRVAHQERIPYRH